VDGTVAFGLYAGGGSEANGVKRVRLGWDLGGAGGRIGSCGGDLTLPRWLGESGGEGGRRIPVPGGNEGGKASCRLAGRRTVDNEIFDIIG
jgi:hypothetical protein